MARGRWRRRIGVAERRARLDDVLVAGDVDAYLARRAPDKEI
jgi:hypothetical protein